MLAIKIYNYLTIKALALVRNLVSFQFYLIGIDTCLLYTNVLNCFDIFNRTKRQRDTTLKSTISYNMPGDGVVSCCK